MKLFLLLSLFIFAMAKLEAKLIYQDDLIFKVGDTIVTHHDLQVLEEHLTSYICLNDTSLLSKYFSKAIHQPPSLKSVLPDGAYTKIERFKLYYLTDYYLLLEHASKSGLEKYDIKKLIQGLRFLATTKKCKLLGESPKEMFEIYRPFATLENFLLQSMTRTNSASKPTSDQITSLLASIRQQITVKEFR